MNEVITKIPGLKVFPYIVEEAKGSNSKFIYFFCSTPGWGPVRAFLKPSDYYITNL